MTGDQMKGALQNAHKYDLGIIAAGLLAFIFSFFPYYTASVSGLGFDYSDSASAWEGFFGWFGVLLGLVGAVILVLSLLRITLPVPTRLTVLGLFAGALLCTVIAFFVFPGGDACQGVQECEDAINLGRGFGFWAVLVMIVAGLALSVMRKDATD